MRINRDRWKWEQKERERERERVVRMALCSGARSLPALFIRSLSLFAGPFARRVSFTCAKGTVAQLSAGDQSLTERAGQRPLPQPLKWLRESAHSFALFRGKELLLSLIVNGIYVQVPIARSPILSGPIRTRTRSPFGPFERRPLNSLPRQREEESFH